MQIIVIAMFVGVGLLAVGEKAEHLRAFVNEGTRLFSYLMMTICRLIPIYVFTALLRQLWPGGLANWLSLWKPMALSIGLIVLFTSLLLVLTARQLRFPMLQLGRKLLPPTLLAFTTASSISAFQSSMDTGREKLGIDPSFMQFAYPIGSVMYMPSSALSLMVLSVYFAQQYGLAVNLSWLIMASVTASLLAIAVPPLPGSGILIFGTLFAQLGIPAEALLMTTLMDMVVDNFITGGNIASLLMELAREAGQLNIIDREKLTQSR